MGNWVTKSIGLAYIWKVNLKKKRAFLLCFILYLRAISKHKHPGTYIRRGDLMEGYEFGARIWRG